MTQPERAIDATIKINARMFMPKVLLGQKRAGCHGVMREFGTHKDKLVHIGGSCHYLHGDGLKRTVESVDRVLRESVAGKGYLCLCVISWEEYE